MRFYVFDVDNRWVNQQFYCEADDLISAHMKAIEFAKLLEQKIKERFNKTLPTQVTIVGEWPVAAIDDDGVEQFLNSLKDYLEVEAE